MNRRNFLSKLAIGAAAVVVAPNVLMSEPEITVIGPAEMLSMQKSLMDNIMNIPVSQWGGFHKPPYRTGGIIQFIAESAQGLHPPELRNDITLVDFNLWNTLL